jgi:hypothetical protein
MKVSGVDTESQGRSLTSRLRSPPTAIVLAFEQLTEELSHLFLGGDQGLSTGRRCAIKPPVSFAFSLLFGYKEPALFQGVEEGIHSAGAEFVAVTREFLNHPQPKHFAITGMVKDVEADQAGVQILMSRIVLLHLRQNILHLRDSLAR